MIKRAMLPATVVHMFALNVTRFPVLTPPIQMLLSTFEHPSHAPEDIAGVKTRGNSGMGWLYTLIKARLTRA
jgi:hypothetical protein